jgi:hypothetical protein
MPAWFYGAIPGLLALGWNVWTWSRERRTRLEVFFGVLHVFQPEGEAPKAYEIVEVVNHSSHDINVDDVGLSLYEGDDRKPRARLTWDKPELATIPGRIAAKDSGFTYREHHQSNMPGVRLSGWAKTATEEKERESRILAEGALVTYNRFFRLIRVLQQPEPKPPSS